MACYSPDRWQRRLLTVGCLTGLLCGVGHHQRVSQAAAMQRARTSAEQFGCYLKRLDRTFGSQTEFQPAMLHLCRRLSAAEYLQDLRSNYPELELPRFSCERLQLSYHRAWELAEDPHSVFLLEAVEERFQNALAFAAMEEDRASAPREHRRRMRIR